MADTDIAIWPGSLIPHPDEDNWWIPESGSPEVGIIMGSASDFELMSKAGDPLNLANVLYEVIIRSAHRNPVEVAEYGREAIIRGLKVVIAGAGLSAALPGVMAAHTKLPVIGVPLTSGTMSIGGGLDALCAIAQMPPGVPVGSMGVNNPKNGAEYALRMINNPNL